MLQKLYTNLISLDFNPKRNLNLRLKRSARPFMENLHECTGTVRCYRPRNSHNFIMLQFGLWSLTPNINTRREQLWKTILNQQKQRRRRTMTGSILKLALFAGPEKSILCWMFLFADASCERRSSAGGCCSSHEVDAHTRNGIFPVEKSQLVPLIAQHDRCPSDICSHRHNWRLTILVPGPTLLEMLWFDRSSTWDEIDKIIELFRFGD